jgi:prepilin-type N-terminal cleavage/methylation domain-containing protein
MPRFRSPTRRGFSLVEVVVAIVLLAIAALGVASSATFVARLAATARALALATRATAQVVDSLRAAPCASLGGGASATAAGTVRWSIASPPGTRRIRAVLSPNSARVTSAVVEEAIVPCE